MLTRKISPQKRIASKSNAQNFVCDVILPLRIAIDPRAYTTRIGTSYTLVFEQCVAVKAPPLDIIRVTITRTTCVRRRLNLFAGAFRFQWPRRCRFSPCTNYLVATVRASLRRRAHPTIERSSLRTPPTKTENYDENEERERKKKNCTYATTPPPPRFASTLPGARATYSFSGYRSRFREYYILYSTQCTRCSSPLLQLLHHPRLFLHRYRRALSSSALFSFVTYASNFVAFSPRPLCSAPSTGSLFRRNPP